MNNEHNFVLIVNEVQKQYMNLRTLGKNRETAIATIKHNYIEAMQDEDDSMAVMIGVVLSLCKKKELTKVKEVRQKKTNTSWYHLCVESRGKMLNS